MDPRMLLNTNKYDDVEKLKGQTHGSQTYISTSETA